jgi:hypothetical protein
VARSLAHAAAVSAPAPFQRSVAAESGASNATNSTMLSAGSSVTDSCAVAGAAPVFVATTSTLATRPVSRPGAGSATASNSHRTLFAARRQCATGSQRSSNAITRGGATPGPAKCTRHSPLYRSPDGVICHARVAPGHSSAAVERA